MFVHVNELSFSSVEGKPLRMLTPLQRRAALEARHPEWRAKTLSQALGSAALAFSERPLVITQSQTYSYRDMQNWSPTLAAGLIADVVHAGGPPPLGVPQFPPFVS